MKTHVQHLLLAAALLAGTAAHAATVTNGNFEDTTGTFPNGWTATGSVTTTGSIVPTGISSALIGASSTLTGDFAATSADALTDFQLDFAFRMSNWVPGNEIQLLDSTGTAIIRNRFNASGNYSVFDSGTARQPTATTGIVFAKNTTYYFRFVGTSFDTAARSYTFGYSTDGISYTTIAMSNAANTAASFSNNGFASAAPGKFDSLKFTVGTTAGFTVDNVSLIDNTTAIPEPSTYGLMGAGAVIAAAVIRRRRKVA